MPSHARPTHAFGVDARPPQARCIRRSPGFAPAPGPCWSTQTSYFSPRSIYLFRGGDSGRVGPVSMRKPRRTLFCLSIFPWDREPETAFLERSSLHPFSEPEACRTISGFHAFFRPFSPLGDIRIGVRPLRQPIRPRSMRFFYVCFPSRTRMTATSTVFSLSHNMAGPRLPWSARRHVISLGTAEA